MCALTERDDLQILGISILPKGISTSSTITKESIEVTLIIKQHLTTIMITSRLFNFKDNALGCHVHPVGVIVHGLKFTNPDYF